MVGDWKDKVGNKLYVRVMTAASANRVKPEQLTEDGTMNLRVYTTAMPGDGETNNSVIELLASELDLPKECLKIIRGENDKNKIIEIKK